jgi:response regulator RpfG family c-di-GMP phosphodiesterase
MAAQPIDLIMTDARMPGMDGAMLLAETHRLYPGTTRILLTGYADISMMIKAINEGQIHRYISKPWNDEEMLLILRQSLEFQHSERERVRLERLTRDQNEQLKALNATGKARRSAHQRAAADRRHARPGLRGAQAQLCDRHRGVFPAGQPAPAPAQADQPPVDRADPRVLQAQALDEASARDLTMAAALYNIGKLSWSDGMMAAPSDMLHSNDRERYRAYPTQSESLLMALEPMKDAARLIRHHQERWDGSGLPDHLKGDAIPVRRTVAQTGGGLHRAARRA